MSVEALHQLPEATAVSPSLGLLQRLHAAARQHTASGPYLEEAARQIQQALGYYHVQIYLLEEGQLAASRLVLQAGTGEVGRTHMLRGFFLPLNARRSLISQAARERKPVVINDVRQSPLHLPNPLLPETRAEAAIPLLDGQQLLGVLDVQHHESGCFNGTAQEMLYLLADQLSSALTAYALRRHTEHLRQHFAALHQVANLTTAAGDENSLIAQVTRVVCEALQAENGGFRLLDPQSGNLRSHSSYLHAVRSSRVLRITGPGEGITGRVLATGQTWRIADVSQEPAFLGDPAIRSELCVPIKLAEETIGVINLESTRLDAFSATDEAVLLTVAAQVAAALQRIRLANRLQRQITERDILLRLMKDASSLQMENVFAAVAQAAKDLLQGDSSRIYLLEADEETLTCVITLSDVPDAVQRFSLKLGQGINGSVALRGTPEIVPNTRYDRRTVYIPGLPPRDMAAALAPIKLRQKVMGVVSVYRLDTNQQFTQADLNLLVVIADQLAVVLSNSRLFAAEYRKREEVSIISAAAILAVEAVNEDELLDRVTRLASARLFSDSFGVMMYDEVNGVLRTHATYHGLENTVPVEGSMVGMVFTSGKPYRTPDILREKRFFEAQFFELGARLHARLSVPLRVQGRPVGVLNAEAKQPGTFVDADEKLFLLLARQLEMALERLQLLDLVQQRAVQQQSLLAMAGTVLTCVNLTDLWTAVSSAAETLLQADRTAVYLVKSDGSSFVCAHAKGLSATFLEDLETHFSQFPDPQLLQNSKPLYIHNVHQHSLAVSALGPIEREGFLAYALIPLIPPQGILMGALGLYYDQPRSFTSERAATAQTMAQVIAIALQNIQVFTERSHALHNEKRLNEFMRRLHAEQGLPNILSSIISHAAALVGADAGLIGLLLDDQTMTYYPYNLPANASLEPSKRKQGIAWQIVESGESILLAHYAQHPRAARAWIEIGVQAFIGVPLETPNGIQGALCLFNFSAHKPFHDKDLRLSEDIVRQAAQAIYNARRYDEAIQRLNQIAITLARQEEQDRQRDNFVHTLSHELRTPLGIIMGHSELLESGILGDLQPVQLESMRIITRRLHMLNKMLTDLNLLLAARMEKGAYQLIQPNLFLDSLVGEFRLQAEELSLTITADLQPELPHILGDVTHLRRVFDNLLANAFKFTPAGGRVEVRAFSEGEYVRFQVRDTGVGIPVDQLERIFDRFYQLRSHKSMNPYGVGLGLALVKELVEAHDGYVRVESEEGHGSTFEVGLPIAQKSA